jgi:hypothetical protein
MKQNKYYIFTLFIILFTSACSPAAPVNNAGSGQIIQNTSTAMVPTVISTQNAMGPAAAASPVPPPQNLVKATATVPSPSGNLPFPIRAAFYYPWFPEAWKQQGMNPFTHYHPDLGYYNQDDPSVIENQISAMQYGKIQAGIASWWGQGSPTDKRIPNLLKLGEKMGFYWAVYAESEGVGNPSVSAIRSDLEYIQNNFANSPAYLKIAGHFVVFAYSDPQDGCDMADRWTQANTVGAYLVLKNFPAYRKCTSQPDGWHQYAPARGETQAQPNSYTISPGFWKGTESTPRLSRDIGQWSKEIRDMMASKASFQLITTFNEWGEGTAVEGANEWKSSSAYGIYLDALHDDGVLPLGLIPANPSSSIPVK